MDNVYINKNHIENMSISELNFDLHDEFGFEYDDKGDNQFVEIQNKRYYTEADPIHIDKLIEKLQKLKKNGATHVEIESNCDHHGYDISSYKIELSTEEDIKNYIEQKNKELEKRKKIQELQSEINKISNQ